MAFSNTYNNMSANSNPPVANMMNLLVQIGAAAPNTIISGSALGQTVFTGRNKPRVSAKKARRRR